MGLQLKPAKCEAILGKHVVEEFSGRLRARGLRGPRSSKCPTAGRTLGCWRARRQGRSSTTECARSYMRSTAMARVNSSHGAFGDALHQLDVVQGALCAARVGRRLTQGPWMVGQSSRDCGAGLCVACSEGLGLPLACRRPRAHLRGGLEHDGTSLSLVADCIRRSADSEGVALGSSGIVIRSRTYSRSVMIAYSRSRGRI